MPKEKKIGKTNELNLIAAKNHVGIGLIVTAPN
jgi:hypothetical protein